jgi:hypothetical protein
MTVVEIFERKKDPAGAIELLQALRAPVLDALLSHAQRFPDAIGEPHKIDPRERRMFPREGEAELPPRPWRFFFFFFFFSINVNCYILYIFRL